MATIVIDIPNSADVTRALDAFAATFNYQAILPGGGANPETKTQFAKRMVAEYIKSIIRGYESQRDAEAARQTAITSANATNVT